MKRGKRRWTGASHSSLIAIHKSDLEIFGRSFSATGPMLQEGSCSFRHNLDRAHVRPFLLD